MGDESFLEIRQPLGELLDLRSFREVCSSFVELYRIGLKVFDASGSILVDIGSGSGEFCGYVYSDAEGARRCTAIISEVKNRPLDAEPTVHLVPCFTGLRYLAMPLLYEGDVVGRAVFGPFAPQDLQGFPPTLTDLKGLDLAHAKKLIGPIRKASDSTIGKVLEHFTGICEVLIFSAYKVFLTSKLHIESVRESYRELAAKASELEQSFEKLQELDQLKSNFLATVSHELRTPLTSIIGYAEMLIEGLAGPLQEEQLEYLHTIMDKGEKLLVLITSILDMTKVEAGSLRLATVEVDLREAFTSAVTSVLPQATKKGVRIVVTEDPDLPQPHLDREKLQQCLVNLMGNAVKFTPAGGSITLSSGKATRPPARSQGRFDGPESYFVVEVKDTGIGIPFEQQERVFDSFYQVDGSATREYGGAGLGLSLVKSYVEAHGGEVFLESTPGQGTTFTMILPRRYVPSVRGEAVSRRIAAGA